MESGKRADRPELAKALDPCRRKKASLVIAKLDRLAGKVVFIAHDLPDANRSMPHIMAAMAAHEREAVSKRAKEALRAAKGRGRKPGWAMPDRDGQARAPRTEVKVGKDAANRFAANVAPIVTGLQKAGVATLRGIADLECPRRLDGPEAPMVGWQCPVCHAAG